MSNSAPYVVCKFLYEAIEYRLVSSGGRAATARRAFTLERESRDSLKNKIWIKVFHTGHSEYLKNTELHPSLLHSIFEAVIQKEPPPKDRSSVYEIDSEGSSPSGGTTKPIGPIC